MPDRRAFVVAFAAVVVLGAGALFAPALLRGRDVIAATPVPPPLVGATAVAIGPGAQLCIAGVDLGDGADVARFARAAPGAPVPVVLEVRGADGRVSRSRAVAPGPAGPVDLRLPPHPGAPPASACLRDAGTVPLALLGSNDPRTAGAPAATLDGRPIAPRVALTTLEGSRASLLARVPQILRHAAAFRPGILGRNVLWILLAALVGLPLGVLAMFRRAA